MGAVLYGSRERFWGVADDCCRRSDVFADAVADDFADDENSSAKEVWRLHLLAKTFE